MTNPNSQQLDQLSTEMKWLVRGLCVTLALSMAAIVFYALAMSCRILKGQPLPPGADAGFIAVTAALFGILITGVFVFMTFRIDRGAIIEARSTAEREAQRVMDEAKQVLNTATEKARTVAKEAIEEAKTQMLDDAKQASESFALDVANRLRERTIEVLRRRNPNADRGIPRLGIGDGQNG